MRENVKRQRDEAEYDAWFRRQVQDAYSLREQMGMAAERTQGVRGASAAGPGKIRRPAGSGRAGNGEG
jgi:hypothetical protein